MRAAPLIVVLAATACAPPAPFPTEDDDTTSDTSSETDAGGRDTDTDVAVDTDVVDTDVVPVGTPWLVFQCAGLEGGVCLMKADGTRRATVVAEGRSPDVNLEGVVLYHTETYHVIRRELSGVEDDLGEGSFARWAPDGRVVFQCNAFNGGLCLMDADGENREPIETYGRVPDLSDDGYVYHSDAYKIRVRPADDEYVELSDGAHARWKPDGTLLFQCSGLNGGICTMGAYGSNRQTFRVKGRNPDVGPGGWLAWHTDAYHVIVRSPAGAEDDLGDGAMVSWQPE